MWTRSSFLTGVAAAAAAGPRDGPGPLEAIERHIGGRLGVFAARSDGAALLSHRASERFPMASTFKLALAMAILHAVERRRLSLNARVRYGRGELLDYSPVTTAHLSLGEMTVAALCAAALQHSDNTAANLLLTQLGGPASVTSFLRAIGDGVTRLDRNEPDVNQATPGDPRDTTTPTAAARDLLQLARGEVLDPAHTALLLSWLRGSTTGGTRIRAGVPSSWIVADKTGTHHTGGNDIALLWRSPTSRPSVLCVYTTGVTIDSSARDRAIADIARLSARLI